MNRKIGNYEIKIMDAENMEVLHSHFMINTPEKWAFENAEKTCEHFHKMLCMQVVYEVCEM